jgi:hypothetical protein
MAALVTETSRRADGRVAGGADAGHGLPAGVAEAGAVLVIGAAMTADDQDPPSALVDRSFCFFFQKEALFLFSPTALGDPYTNPHDCACIGQIAQ